MPKKIKGPIKLQLKPNQFCTVWEQDARECIHGLKVIADATYYNLLYQNGEFFGIIKRNGGIIYPFSHNPLKKGFRFRNKDIATGKVVCISSAYNLNMGWGTKPGDPFMIYDKNGTPCYFGASGTLYVELNPGDNGTNAHRFYRELLSQGSEDQRTVTAVKEKLYQAFINVIGSMIEEILSEMDRPISQLVDLTPNEKLKVSEKVYYKLKEIFDPFGLTLNPVSKNSCVAHLIVRNDKNINLPNSQDANFRYISRAPRMSKPNIKKLMC